MDNDYSNNKDINNNIYNMKKINIIVAVDREDWIGKDWDLAWKLSKDMQYFKKTTVCTSVPNKINMLVMGRKTWDSIPLKFRPLPGRINTVLTRNKDFKDEWCVSFSSISKMLEEVKKIKTIENIFIIGGASIYTQFLKSNVLDKIYITKINKKYDCDVFFPKIPGDFVLEWVSDLQEENWVSFSFEVYKKK